MKRFSFIMVCVLMLSLLVTGTVSSFAHSNKNSHKTTLLTESNLVMLDQEINYETIDKALIEIINNKSSTIYLYIDSPGGSVDAGYKLVNYLQGSGKNVVCISSVAISMAFAIMQACPVRLVMFDSTLMQHEPTFGIGTHQVSNYLSFLDHILHTFDVFYKMQADRIGISVEKFKALIKDDWWIMGADAVEKGVADHVTTLLCSKELIAKTITNEVVGFFGPVLVTVSACPLIKSPLKIEPLN